ncbi:hypothetical protein Tco_0134371 [Tanacetum coccineum]
MHRSDPESEHSEQSTDDISKQDEGNVSDMEDTDNAHIPKVSTTTRTGKKKLCKADLEGPAFNLVKAFHKNSVFLQYQMDECHKLLTNKVDKKPVSENRVGDLQLGIESYQTKINLERPNWDAADYYFKEDYTIVPKPRAVMIADIEDSHHGHSDAMQQPSLASESFKRFLFHFSQRLNTLSINFLTPKHPSETIVFHNEEEILLEPTSNKLYVGYLKDGDGDGNSQHHKGVKASANSDVMYSFTSAQEGNPLQDDVRLCLGDDLKKAQDHSQRQLSCLLKEQLLELALNLTVHCCGREF